LFLFYYLRNCLIGFSTN